MTIVRSPMMSSNRPPDETSEQVPAYAISWFVLAMMLVAILLGLFLMLRPA